MTAPRFIEVALPLPLFQTFTYAVGDGSMPEPGARVLVPVRNKRAIGIVVGATDGAGIARPRAILEAPDVEPVLSAQMLDLCRWIAEYYVVPLGVVMRSVLPVMLTGERAPTPSAKTQRIAVIARELPSLQERDALFGRAARQRALYEVLEGMGGRGEVPHLTGQLGFGAELVRALETRGLITIETSVVARDPFSRR
jgi:primosomal protein N' (replication factor Y)